MTTGFEFGDHTFLSPGAAAPLSRISDPKKVIRGAPPPSYLDGLVRETEPGSDMSDWLRSGEFAGHGEPTITVFDVVIDGADEIEIDRCEYPEDSEEGGNLPLVVARKPGSDRWFVLFDRAWELGVATLEDQQRREPTADECARLTGEPNRARVSVGFEYPPDAESRDGVTWLTICAMLDNEAEPMCIVDAELA